MKYQQNEYLLPGSNPRGSQYHQGEVFENLVEYHENNDGDQWTAMLHKDESYPGSDIVLTNMENGEILEISLKATDDHGYIETPC